MDQGGDMMRDVAGGRRDATLERVAGEDDFPGAPRPSGDRTRMTAAHEAQDERSKWHRLVS